MNAYLIERLTATGWKRPTEICYRYEQAIRRARSHLADMSTSVRIMPVQIGNDPVWQESLENEAAECD